MSETSPTSFALSDQRVYFAGKLGGMNRKEAQTLVRQHGGVPAVQFDGDVTIIVIGADELPIDVDGDILNQQMRDAAACGRMEILPETGFWTRIGVVDAEQQVRRLYTPAMLAGLLNVPVSTIRSWHRRNLITPVRSVRKLPYFDFQEVATARQLAQLLAAGATPHTIEKQLADLARFLPDAERPLAQLGVIVEGQRILLREGDGLIEPGGQMLIDFEALPATGAADSAGPETLALPSATLPLLPGDAPMPVEQMLEMAAQCEEEGRIDDAIDCCRAALAAGGLQAGVCFQLAELLYRNGDLHGARERYYTAIEIDEDYVEARSNLGCVLAETGQLELAVAAFEGALDLHASYPDAHYHLARALDELNRPEEAAAHWSQFQQLAPGSPWADEASARLGDFDDDDFDDEDYDDEDWG